MAPLTTSEVLGEHAREGTEVLDGFRGLAIVLVLVYHTWLFSWFTPDARLFGVKIPLDVVARTGYLGVELFFAISGFVLFFPIVERHFRGGAPTPLRTFAIRRFLKIAPSYAIALIFTAISVRSLHVDVALGPTLGEHALLIQNFFSDNFGKANSVFWSLAIEAQFYLVFPALAWIFVRRPFLVAAGMVALALAYRYGVANCCLLVEPVNRQLPAFADIFASGMLCAYGVSRLRDNDAFLTRARPVATVVAIVAALGTIALLNSANAIQYDVGGREKWILLNRTLFALATSTLIFASCFAVRFWRALVANPIATFFSLISYNVYLWHTLVMIWLWKHGAIPSRNGDPHGDPRWKLFFITSGWALSLGIATVLTYFVERPILSASKPQNFAFHWKRIRPGSRRPAPRETRT
jgi:peptidoglycan/LPS O-acetylase OafA/YrhL